MSPGCKGFHGWSMSLTSFADVSFEGPGGGSAWRTWSFETMRSRSSIGRPASDPYAGKPVTTETKVRVEKPRKCMSFIFTVVGNAFCQKTRGLYIDFKIHLPQFRVIEQHVSSAHLRYCGALLRLHWLSIVNNRWSPGFTFIWWEMLTGNCPDALMISLLRISRKTA